MIERMPSMAPFSPPETGASSIFTPFWARAAPTFCETIGEMVDMSARTWPLRTPSSNPFGPRATSSTSGEFGSMVMMTSPAARAAAAGESAVFAPSPASSWTAAWLRLWTTSAWPAFRRFLAMGRPMIPSPMNPIGPCMASVSSQSLAATVEAGLRRPGGDVENGVDYRSGARPVKWRSVSSTEPRRRYRPRAIHANVGAVQLPSEHVVPWQPHRLSIDPWTVLRLARYRRREDPPAAVWDATRAMATRAGELAAPAARLRVVRVTAIDTAHVSIAGGTSFSGRAVARHLTGASRAIAFV